MPNSSVVAGNRVAGTSPSGRIVFLKYLRVPPYPGPVGRFAGLGAICALTASLLLALGGLVLLALPASADLGKAPDRTVGANDRVWAIVRAGDRIYLGGRFTALKTEDGQSIARNRLAAVDANTGEVVADWNPNANGIVRAMSLSPDGRRLYIGGSFTSVGGHARNNLAAIDLATGAVDGGWEAGTNRVVNALATSGSGGVYVGGNFTMAKGKPRTGLAKFDGATGTLDPIWSPSADQTNSTYGSVRALEFSEDESRLYAGGYFGSISGQHTGNLVALDPATGTVDGAFRPNETNGIQSMAVYGGRVFVGTGDHLEGIEAFDGATGSRDWYLGFGDHSPGTGDVQAMTVSQDGTLYAGGHFDKMHDLTKHRLVAVDAATGVVDSQWNPNVAAGGNSGVWALEAYGTYLYAGGDFTSISGRAQERFARFTDGPDQPDRGLTGEYFDNTDFTGSKTTRMEAVVDFAWGNYSPPGIDNDTFSALWRGQVKPKYSETYTFYTTSDDGVRLWVDGQKVIDNWTDHAPTINSGQIALTAGQLYNVRMEYYENGGGAQAKLEWSSASEPKWLVPQTRLYPAQ